MLDEKPSKFATFLKNRKTQIGFLGLQFKQFYLIEMAALVKVMDKDYSIYLQFNKSKLAKKTISLILKIWSNFLSVLLELFIEHNP